MQRSAEYTRAVGLEVERGSKKIAAANSWAFAELACKATFRDTQTQGRNAHSGQQPTIVCVSRLIDKPKDLLAIIMIVGVSYRSLIPKLPVGRQEVSVNYSGVYRLGRRTDIYPVYRITSSRCSADHAGAWVRDRSLRSTSLSGLTDEQKNNTREENKERYALTDIRGRIHVLHTMFSLACIYSHGALKGDRCTTPLAPVNWGVKSH